MDNIQEYLEEIDQYIISLRRGIDMIHLELYIESMGGSIETKTTELLH